MKQKNTNEEQNPPSAKEAKAEQDRAELSSSAKADASQLNPNQTNSSQATAQPKNQAGNKSSPTQTAPSNPGQGEASAATESAFPNTRMGRRAFMAANFKRPEPRRSQHKRIYTTGLKPLLDKDSASARAYVSPWIQVSAAWSWRLLLIAAGLVAILWVMAQVSAIVISLALALLLALLLNPLVAFLRNRLRFPNLLATTVGLVVGLVFVGVLMYVTTTQLWRQAPILLSDSIEGIQQLLSWSGDTFGVSSSEINRWLESFGGQASALISANYSTIASEAVSLARLLLDLVTGLLIMVFVLFFLLKDGRQIWIWFVRCVPEPWRVPVHEAGVRGWYTLTAYVRTQIRVAALDAVGIGLGAFFLNLPAVIPIMILVFLGAFVPIVGAFLSGAIAVLIALVTQGPMQALIMLAVVLLVQFLEGHVFQPLLMSNAVSLHPVATVLAVTVGTTVAGVTGALFAVPIVAFLNTVCLYLHGHDPFPELATKETRAGGAPGTLGEQLAKSYGQEVEK